MRRLLGAGALLAASYLLGTPRPSDGGAGPPLAGPGEGDRPAVSRRGLVLRWAKRLVAAAAVLAAGGFLVAASGVIPVKASSGHWPITEWFLHFSMERSIATHSLGTEIPPLDDPALVLKGAGQYETACRPCHGSPGLHHPRVAAAMTPPPPYLPPRIPDWDPEELFHITKHGIKFAGMPAWPTQRRDDEVWAMTAFLLAYADMTEEEYERLVRGETRAGGETDRPEAAPLQGMLGPAAAPQAVLANCGRCHGVDGLGRGNAAFPKLAGRSPASLEAALRAYAAGERHSGLMEPVAAALDPETVRELARYYAGLDPGGPADRTPDPAAVARGEAIARDGVPERRLPACVACHGPGDGPRNPLYPDHAGQYADYLVLQLTLFKERRRGGSDYAHLMHPVADQMTPGQMRDVAAYYASLRPGRGRGGE